MKKIILSLLGLGVVAYAGSVAYLQYWDHATAPRLPADSPTRQDAVAMAAFSALREARCDFCHASHTELPFYFHVPLANQLMSKDVSEGLRHFRIEPVLAALQQGKPVSEEQLGRIEEVISQGRMPPDLYVFMHWHAHLNASQDQAVLSWVQDQRRRYYATPGVAADHAADPIQPIPESLPVNAAQVALGEKLFFDKQLSGDGSLNCASCHDLQHGGVDGLVTATGIHGQKGPINAPTVYNAVFNKLQFWNGRAKDLAEQAGGPVMNPLEMGSHDWTAVAARLNQNPAYAAQFQSAFGSPLIDQHSVTAAIAAFETTLITPDSRFDKYLKGDSQAITAEEKHGYALFRQIGCSGCHNGVAAGGGAFEVMGLEGHYFDDRGGKLTDADAGRIAVTKDALDNNRFKVPTLRNVALTAPYFHDGSAKTLEQAVREMARYQTPDKDISDADVKAIVAFLDTLTGTWQGKPLAEGATAEAH
ncbi:cytochrome-c peroxidase [Frateuria aurantia]